MKMVSGTTLTCSNAAHVHQIVHGAKKQDIVIAVQMDISWQDQQVHVLMFALQEHMSPTPEIARLKTWLSLSLLLPLVSMYQPVGQTGDIILTIHSNGRFLHIQELLQINTLIRILT